MDEHAIGARFAGAVVLVTGAAGSIGSELCRQLARFGAGRVIAFDISEGGLFELTQDADERIVPVVGNVQNAARVQGTFDRYQPSVVFHAAAYKHVALMEANAAEAIENNVSGTLTAANAAVRSGVRTFVLVSSDKAVQPASVMGASKRAAEILVQSIKPGGTEFLTVRFGNVLGSSGSVVPIFARQIERGGPVTVTHPEMRRYFLTPTEAAQFMLQACIVGHGGETLVFDTGEPVRIVDLASRMIALSGRKVEIVFTQPHAAEKLCEHLFGPDENPISTGHKNIQTILIPQPAPILA